MAKKSKGKGGSKVSEEVEEEISESGKELYVPIPEEGGLINFYYLINGIAVVMAIIMIGYILLHYVLHSV